jgi:hypothetical protein
MPASAPAAPLPDRARAGMPPARGGAPAGTSWSSTRCDRCQRIGRPGSPGHERAGRARHGTAARGGFGGCERGGAASACAVRDSTGVPLVAGNDRAGDGPRRRLGENLHYLPAATRPATRPGSRPEVPLFCAGMRAPTWPPSLGPSPSQPAGVCTGKFIFPSARSAGDFRQVSSPT